MPSVIPDPQLERRIRGLGHLVGNTPLLAIEFTYRGERRFLYAKAEHLNMTGSIKDRMALHIVQQGYAGGALKPGAPMVEATSGNTGISIAGIGRALGHPVTIFMPDWMSTERIDLIRSLGADVNLVSSEEGGFLGSIHQAKEFARSVPDAFLSSQFSNVDNIAAHEATTGQESWWQLRFHSLTPSAVVAGVGTGGTIMGVGRFFKSQNSNVKLFPVEPANSPTLSTGHKVGKHRIQGISDEFIPPIVDLDFLDDVIGVDDGDAIVMARRLAAELGIGVGISSGANFIGAVKAQNELGNGAVVVTVFPDDNKKYLSTDLLADEPVKDEFLSKDIELTGFGAFKRVCHTCCDPADCMEADPVAGTGETELLLPHCPRRVKPRR
jgi:cysteine synthase A